MINREAIKNANYSIIGGSVWKSNATRNPGGGGGGGGSIKDLTAFGHLVDLNLSQSKSTAFNSSQPPPAGQSEQSFFSSISTSSSSSSNLNRDLTNLTGFNYPKWCSIPTESNSPSTLPPVYIQVWKYCLIAENPLFCDTSKLYPILLSSGLNTGLLAQIWSLVNITTPGQLTCQELFLALAFIALTQENPNESPSIQRLYTMSMPPTPLLRIPALLPNYTQALPCQPQQQQQLPQGQQRPSPLVKPVGFPPIESFESNLKPAASSNNLMTTSVHEDDFSDFQTGTMQPEIGKRTLNLTKSNQESNYDAFRDHTLNSSPKEGEIEIGRHSDSMVDWTSDFQSVFDDLNCTNSFTSCTESTNDCKSPKAELNELDVRVGCDQLLKRSSLDSSVKPGLNLPSVASSEQNLWSSILNEFSLKTGTSTSNKRSPQTSVPQTVSSQAAVVETQSKSSESSVVDTGDRYKAFKELTSEEKSPVECPPEMDDFGEFKSHSSLEYQPSSLSSIKSYNNNETSGPSGVDNEVLSCWAQVLNASKQVLHKAFNVLVVDHGQSCSIEALQTDKGHDFCLDIIALYSITWRISNRYKESGLFNGHIVQLLSDIQVTYNALQKLFNEAGIKEITVPQAETSDADHCNKICKICHSPDSGPDLSFLYFAGHDYHSSCANFWLNCIDSSLPTTTSNNLNLF